VRRSNVLRRLIEAQERQKTQEIIWAQSVTSTVGSGLPVGGDADQVLAKASATDYDVAWQNVTLDLDENEDPGLFHLDIEGNDT
jgi:hypothetical protein